MYLLPEAFGSGRQSPEDPLKGWLPGASLGSEGKGQAGFGVEACLGGRVWRWALSPAAGRHWPCRPSATFTRRAAVVSCGVGRLRFSFVLAYIYSLQLTSYFYGDLS